MAKAKSPVATRRARRLLRRRGVEPPTIRLKALLASAPLEGIELDRGPDPGRDVAAEIERPALSTPAEDS
jgi:hypothetical protein